MVTGTFGSRRATEPTFTSMLSPMSITVWPSSVRAGLTPGLTALL